MTPIAYPQGRAWTPTTSNYAPFTNDNMHERWHELGMLQGRDYSSKFVSFIYFLFIVNL
jgi:hypothetical protein